MFSVTWAWNCHLLQQYWHMHVLYHVLYHKPAIVICYNNTGIRTYITHKWLHINSYLWLKGSTYRKMFITKQNQFIIYLSNWYLFPYSQTSHTCKNSSTYFLKKTSTYFPNRLELSLRMVLALPNDSSRGFASRIWSVITLVPDLLTAARYCITSFVLSVFPAPLSPLQHKCTVTDLRFCRFYSKLVQ